MRWPGLGSLSKGQGHTGLFRQFAPGGLGILRGVSGPAHVRWMRPERGARRSKRPAPRILVEAFGPRGIQHRSTGHKTPALAIRAALRSRTELTSSNAIDRALAATAA